MANIELDGANKKIKVDSGDLTLDVPGDIILDADGANVTFKDGGTSVLDLSNSSTDAVLTVSTQDKDLIIKGDDGGSAITAATFDMSDAGTLILNHDLELGIDGPIIKFGADNEIALTHVADTGLLLQDSGGTPTLQLHDSNESIASDGSKVIITSGGTAFSLPTSDGSNGQVLATNGSGVLSFTSASGGDLSFGGDTFGENKTIGANDAYSLTLETNNAAAMVISAAGEITKPLQPCFSVTHSVSQANLTEEQQNTITFGNEIFDINGDFASNTFTAPVTGKYLLTAKLSMAQIDHDATYYSNITINTSNRNYKNAYSVRDFFEAQPEFFVFTCTCIADMDASDTAVVEFGTYGPGASQEDVYGTSADATQFMGQLIS